MSCAFFADPGVVSDLLAVCRAEGLLLPRVEKKVRMLLAQGLHPEQALLGTRLVSLPAYGEALERVFGVPFVRIARTSSVVSSLVDSSVLLRHRAVLVDHRPKTAMVAFADPSCLSDLRAVRETLHVKGVELVPAVGLWSEIRMRADEPLSDYSVRRLRRALEAAWQAAGTHAFEMSHVHEGGVHVHTEGRDVLPSEVFPSSASLSALAMHLDHSRTKDKMPWQVRAQRVSHGMVVSGQLKESWRFAHHPLAWSAIVREFLRAPRGVLACLHSDASFRSRLATVSLPPLVYDLQQDEEEEALHAALAGRPIVLLSVSQPVWLSQLVPLGVPVHVLERHAVPAGMSWTAYSL